METITLCIKKNIDVPYFVLSCPTNYDIPALLRDLGDIFDKERFSILLAKFKFFPLCEHGRTSRNKYLKDSVMPFELNDSFIKEEDLFLSTLGAS